MTLRACLQPMSVALVAALIGSCGDPFTQPDCYNGPGCGEDKVPPVATITEPAPYATVSGNFWVYVSATDNIGVLGVDFWLYTWQLNPQMVTKPPYRWLVDPTYVAPNPGGNPGLRDLTILVHDVAGNIDTLYLTVNYQP